MSSAARRAPPPDSAWAYFLDLDGTLAELAPSPGEACVGPEARRGVAALHAACGGALALVSGRPVAEVDAMLGIDGLPVAGQHGLERRGPGGLLQRHEQDLAPLRAVGRRLAPLVARHRGLMLEDKGMTLALHYRAAPALASFAHRTVRALQREAGAVLCVQPGKRVVELKPAGHDKGTAVAEFMREVPFRGRLPVYLGDDATDEHAFRVVNAMGGHSIKVGGGASDARWRLADVASVHEWMERVRRGR